MAKWVVPPLTKWQSMPSSALTLPTSSTVSNIACCIAIAAGRPCSLAILADSTAKRAEHQPPLRPDAPNPAISASRIVIRSDGSARRR